MNAIKIEHRRNMKSNILIPSDFCEEHGWRCSRWIDLIEKEGIEKVLL